MKKTNETGWILKESASSTSPKQVRCLYEEIGDKIGNFAGPCKENIEESRNNIPKMTARPPSNPKSGQNAGTKAQKTGASADVSRQTMICRYG